MFFRAFAALFLIVMISMAQAAPTDNGDGFVPQSRVTCDLFSMFGVADTACAAHCLGMGYRGGYCNSMKVCVCR